jgi:hypothetical protein
MQLCKGERKDNVAVEYLKRFKGEEGVLFRGAVQVDQVLLDPVTAEVAILLLDVLTARDRAVVQLLSVELHVVYQITEGVG